MNNRCLQYLADKIFWQPLFDPCYHSLHREFSLVFGILFHGAEAGHEILTHYSVSKSYYRNILRNAVAVGNGNLHGNNGRKFVGG